MYLMRHAEAHFTGGHVGATYLATFHSGIDDVTIRCEGKPLQSTLDMIRSNWAGYYIEQDNESHRAHSTNEFPHNWALVEISFCSHSEFGQNDLYIN